MTEPIEQVILRLAARATPGPWVSVLAFEDCPISGGPDLAIQRANEPWKRTGTIATMYAQGVGRYDAAMTASTCQFIAACDPATVSRLARVVGAARLEHATHDHRVVPCDIWVCQVLAVLDADAPEGGTA